ncbi:MAG: NAD-dependent epimerase/dehydratase family protein [Tepidisphaeraceae bacterium]
MNETTRPRRRVLVTGAAGNIGSSFCRQYHDRYDLRLMVMPGEPNADVIRPFGEVVEADICDAKSLPPVMQGIDTCVHLAGNPDASAKWDSLLPVNIVGTYNVFVAARAAHLRRVIYASSIHAVSGGPTDVQVKPDDPVNPGDLYGVSKCFGEALARYMAEQEGLSSIALRIGSFQPREVAANEKSIPMMDSWVSDRDLCQLIARCIDAEDLKFAIFHGVSDNAFKRLDISNARALVGYAPEDDFGRQNPKLEPLHLHTAIRGHNTHDAGQASALRDELKTETN